MEFLLHNFFINKNSSSTNLIILFNKPGLFCFFSLYSFHNTEALIIVSLTNCTIFFLLILLVPIGRPFFLLDVISSNTLPSDVDIILANDDVLTYIASLIVMFIEFNVFPILLSLL